MRPFKMLLATCMAVLVMSGCSSRKAVTKISKKVTDKDSAGASYHTSKTGDSTTRTTTTINLTNEKDLTETIIYPKSGANVIIDADGRFHGAADSTKTKRHSDRHTWAGQQQKESNIKTTDNVTGQKSQVKQHNTEQVKDKVIDKKGIDPAFKIAGAIVLIFLLLLAARWALKKWIVVLFVVVLSGSQGCTQYMADGRAYRTNTYCIESHSETHIRYDLNLHMYMPETRTVCDHFETDTVWMPEKNRTAERQ